MILTRSFLTFLWNLDKNESIGLRPPSNELKEGNQSMAADNSQHLQSTALNNCMNYNANNRWNLSRPGEQLNIDNITETSTEGGYPNVSTNSNEVNQQHSDWAKHPSWSESEKRSNDLESMTPMHGCAPLPPMQYPYGNVNECNNPSFIGGNTLNSNRDGSFGRNSNRVWTNVPPNQYRPFATRPPRGGPGGNVLHGPQFFNRGGSRLSGHTGIMRTNNFRTKMRGKSNWI